MTIPNEKNKEIKQKPRQISRQYAIQALYQWHYNQAPVEELIRFIHNEHDISNANLADCRALITSVIAHQEEIDELIISTARRTLKSLNPVELAILRVAVCEFLHYPNIPYRVVINEALNLTKAFGAKEGFRFVNGVLDALAKALRASSGVNR